jgi:MoaA/NifB/PqqE/SkfB family radical SAM enzyme
MSDTIFKKSLQEFVALGGECVSFTPFSGEPLIDPNIIERISYAKSLGARTFMFTNGILLNRIDLEKFLKSGINTLTVSTAPFDREAYEILFRNKHYHDLVEGVCQILFLRNRFRPDLTINIAFRSHVPMRQVLKLPDFLNRILPLLSEKDLDALIVNTRGYDNWGGQINKNDMVGIMRLALPPRLKYRPCTWTLLGPYVTFDGQVRACACRFAATENRDSKDDLWVGDITKSSLADIWFGDRVKDLHRRFTSCNLPIACQKCTMYRSC